MFIDLDYRVRCILELIGYSRRNGRIYSSSTVELKYVSNLSPGSAL